MSWLPKSNIVVPIDFSDESEQAIRTALELADDPSHVHLVHVLFPLDSVSPGVVWGETDDTKREKAVNDYFDTYLAEKGVEGVRHTVLFGNPGHEISEYATNNAADLIVIPAHGYHGIKRYVLGSVAERVIRLSKCPVLVLRRHDQD